MDLQQVNNLKQYESLPILMTGKDRENDWTHIVIKDWHHNQSFFMQFTESTKQILRSLLWRSQKYRMFWFSRHEYEKFWLTERTLRTIIEKLQAEKIIKKVYTETYSVDWKPRRRNIWIATDRLLELVKSFSEAIADMNDKIISWCKNQNPVQTLREFGVQVFSGGRLWDKKSKVTVNKKTWAIKDWKTWKSYNLYNYLRESLECSHTYFFKHFIW
mgnify:FL=1